MTDNPETTERAAPRDAQTPSNSSFIAPRTGTAAEAQASARVAHQAEGSAGRTRRRRLFEEALAAIERDYRSELTIESLGQLTFTSRRHLQRAFAESGTSVSETLLTARMDRAAELLREPRRPVQEVAHAVGYRHPAQFAKAFKRRHGQSPSHWRETSAGALAA